MGLEPAVRDFIDKMDFEALGAKLKTSKDLFFINDERKEGIIKLDDLMFELKSGGLSAEHEAIVIRKFAEKGNDYIDFMVCLYVCKHAYTT